MSTTSPGGPLGGSGRRLPDIRVVARLAADVGCGPRVVPDPLVVVAVLVDRRLVDARLLQVAGYTADVDSALVLG